jgi:hypothetical protein
MLTQVARPSSYLFAAFLLTHCFAVTCCVLQGLPQSLTAAAGFTLLHLSSSTPLISFSVLVFGRQ